MILYCLLENCHPLKKQEIITRAFFKLFFSSKTQLVGFPKRRQAPLKETKNVIGLNFENQNLIFRLPSEIKTFPNNLIISNWVKLQIINCS